MDRLKIIHVTPYFEKAWAYGGIPRVCSAQVRALDALGHKITVATTDACDAGGRLIPDGSLNEYQSLTDVRVFKNVSNTLAYHAQLFLPIGFDTFLIDHIRRYDIAHLHGCHNLLGTLAAKRLGANNIPYVVQPNGTAKPIERRILAKKVFKFIFGRVLLADAARVISVSRTETDSLRSLGVENARITMIANPMDIDEFDSVNTLAPPEWYRRFDRVVLYLGQITPRKRLDLLIDAVARLETPATGLVIAGGSASDEKALQEQITNLGITGRVIFTGVLKGRERLSALSYASVLVYPTENEIFGLVPLEALLCGTPVIIAGGSGSAEVIGKVGGGLIITPGDTKAFTESIATMLEDPNRWCGEVEIAKSKIRQLYASPVIAHQLEQLYRNVIEA